MDDLEITLKKLVTQANHLSAELEKVEKNCNKTLELANCLCSHCQNLMLQRENLQNQYYEVINQIKILK